MKYSGLARMAQLMIATGVFGFATTTWAIPTLTLTETSESNVHFSWSDGGPSGDLTLTKNAPGNPYGPNSSQFAGSIASPNLGQGIADDLVARWKEPSGGEVNVVTPSWDGSGDFSLLIDSDSTYTSYSLVENGATVVSGDNEFAVRFIDQADTQPSASAPDSGATSTLLGLAFAGMIGAVRLRR